jgi:hypothetical protein
VRRRLSLSAGDRVLLASVPQENMLVVCRTAILDSIIDAELLAGFNGGV